MDIHAHLAANTLFTGLANDTADLLASQCRAFPFDAGECVIEEGERGDCYFLVATGEVSVLKGAGISQRELTRLGPGQGFGEMALIADEPRSATVITRTPSVLLRIERDDFQVLMERDAKFAQRMLRMISARLQESDTTATRDLLHAHQGLVFALAELAESRDVDTGAHLYRVRDHCALLSKLLAEQEIFKAEVTSAFIEAIYHVSPLHDIGKVGIPDSILKKPGKLTVAEFDIMKTHTTLGARSIAKVREFCDLDMFRMAHDLVLGHHECFDGSGYPGGAEAGQTGYGIALAARVMTLADFFDALLSPRVYKPAFSLDKSVAIIKEESGRKFDPAIVSIMLDNLDAFAAIHKHYTD